MEHTTRLWLELETNDHGPSGVVRDQLGRTTPFTGWLELIAAIETPAAFGELDMPPRDGDQAVKTSGRWDGDEP